MANAIKINHTIQQARELYSNRSERAAGKSGLGGSVFFSWMMKSTIEGMFPGTRAALWLPRTNFVSNSLVESVEPGAAYVAVEQRKR
jgi:hypothetical protein